MRRRRGLSLFNILAVLLLVVACASAAVIALAATAPEILPEGLTNLLPLGDSGDGTDSDAMDVPTLISQAAVPTTTPTATATATIAVNLEPTWTPDTAQGATAAPTNTRRPTSEPSATPILPSRTATPTDTPTPTNTPTFTHTPPPNPTNTRSPQEFTKTLNSPRFDEQRFYDVNCNWMGFAGQVLDINGNPLTNRSFRVHVWEDRSGGIDARAVVGDAPIYGAAAWEQYVREAPLVWTYFVQLEDGSGNALSQVYQVTTRASCRENLIYFDFVQNHTN